MSTPSTHQITEWLVGWSNGDRTALDKLTPLVYRELHRLAQVYMRNEHAGHPLQATALVNEAYIRLLDAERTGWPQNRVHFYAVAAQMMRHILVDFARSRARAKRGHGAEPLPLDEALTVAPDRSAEIVNLDEALTNLAKLHERQSKVVELRFFGGLTEPEIAEILKVSPRTVHNDWNLARSWLLQELDERGT